MKYDTNNLDEAAYLALQGYPFTVTRTGQVSALFSFETDERFDEVRTRFWKGKERAASPRARHADCIEKQMRWPGAFGKACFFAATRTFGACSRGGRNNGPRLLVP